jgi:uncharacterized protein YybS (DUF2232 family)
VDKTKILTESAVMLALYIVLFLMTLYIPILGQITLFMLALPFVVYSVRRGWKNAVYLLIAALILTILFGTLLSIPTTLLFGTSGIVMGHLYKVNRSRFEVLSFGSITYLVNLLLLYGIVTTLLDINPLQEAKKAAEESIVMTREMMEGMGQTINEAQLEQLEQVLDLAPLMIPTVIVLVSVLLAFVTQFLSTLVLKRLGYNIEKWPPFRELRLPRSIVWYYLLVMVLMIVPIDKESVIYLGVFNLFYILQLLMVLQGLSFIFFYCYHKKLSKGIPITILILTIFLPFLLYIVRIIGIIDLGFNIREKVITK